MVEYFKPKHKSGFSEGKSVGANLRAMHGHTPKNIADDSRWRRVGRTSQALANVTKDRTTRVKAQEVADRAFRKLR